MKKKIQKSDDFLVGFKIRKYLLYRKGKEKQINIMKDTFNKIIRKIRLGFNAWYVHTLLVMYDAIYGEYERKIGKAYE